MPVTPVAAPPRRRPRVGFLGLGWIGLHRMRAIARGGAVDIVALADLSDAAIAEATLAAPGAVACRTLEDLLAQDLDGVVIATPSALHAAQATAALQAGVAVFCQKPLGRDAAEAAGAVAAARAADRLLCVDLSYRHTAAMQAIRRVLDEGGIGEVFAIDLTFHNAYGPDKAWFYDKRWSGGGCVMDLGVHMVDLALWTLDYPPVARTQARLLSGGVPVAPDKVEDFAMVTLELEEGPVLRLACSWNLSAGQDAVIGAAFHGTGGGLEMRNLNGSFFDFTAQRHHGTGSEVMVAPPDDWGGRAAADWAARLAAGAGYDAQAERLVALSQVLDGIYAAAARAPGLRLVPDDRATASGEVAGDALGQESGEESGRVSDGALCRPTAGSGAG